MRKKLLLSAILLFTVFLGKAQDGAAAKAESTRLTVLSKQLEGTYQIQVINSRALPTFPMKYLDEIATRRLAADTTYYPFPDNPNFRILILPAAVINAPNFKKPERIVYVEH